MKIRTRWSKLPALTLALALMVMFAACGDDDASSEETTTAPTVAVPTTYIILRNGPYSGTLESIGESSGTITFTISETSDSTHEVLADGQITVYDFVISDVVVNLDLVDHPCGDTPLTGEYRVVSEEGFAADTSGHFGRTTDVLSIRGTRGLMAADQAGEVTVTLTPEAGDPCTYGPVRWEAATP